MTKTTMKTRRMMMKIEWEAMFSSRYPFDFRIIYTYS